MKLVCAGHCLTNWEIKDVSFLAGLDKLEWLNLAGNPIADPSVLRGFSGLVDLEFDAPA